MRNPRCINWQSDTALPSLASLASPHISIVVTNHNYGRFLEQALQSATRQTYACEVIVVDDGSSDESSEVLARWEDRLQVIRQANQGQCAAYNAGFAASRGDVVVFLDADDFLALDAAATLRSAFERGVAKVHYRLSLVDAGGGLLGPEIPSALAGGDVGERLARSGILHTSAPGSGNAYRRSVLERLFPIPVTPGDPVGADFFTIFGSALFGQVVAIDRALGFYRVHAAADASAGMVFANAAQDASEIARVAARKQVFRRWIAERTGGALQIPESLTSFAESKGAFVAALAQSEGLPRFVAGLSLLPALASSLWSESERSLAMRGALSGWMVLSVVLPRRFADPLVRYGANPASRRGLREVLRWA